MNTTTYNAHYMFEEDSMNFDFPVEIHVSRFHNNQFITLADVDYKVPFDNPDAFKVYLNTTEPSTSPNREPIETIIRNANQYDLILTTDVEILENCPNAIMFPYGTTWLNTGKIDHPDGFGEYDESLDELHENKRFEISFLCSNHARSLEGYDKRKEIWSRRSEFENPTLFYSSTRHPISPNILPEDDKKYLFNSQFHITIESSTIPNYFSEKLIDALITKTVPIYWGCPNIGDFFDARGMIIVDSETDVVEVCNNITSETYEEMKPFVDENYKRAREYARPFSDRVKEEILREIRIREDENKPKLLTIGICHLNERKEKLEALLVSIQESAPQEYMNKIEIVVNADNGEKSVGQKRNEILSSANGRFISFVDDDDLISKEYVKCIVNCIEHKRELDCIGFTGKYYVNGVPSGIFKHANSYGGNFKDHINTPSLTAFRGMLTANEESLDADNIQYRPCNHLNPVRTSIAQQIGFPDKNYGEDSDYSDRLLESGLLKNEMIIRPIMYHYFFNEEASRTSGGKEYIAKPLYERVNKFIQYNNLGGN